MEPQETFLQSEQKPPVLPWERAGGHPLGTGICLSGGGIRAAMFSLGVLQRLQEARGLVFGTKSADVLSVVSGGSYMAGAHALGAIRRAAPGASYGTTDPLAAGTPEERHILANGAYLRRNPGRYLGFAFLNFVSVLSLFAMLGFILACLAAILRGLFSETWAPGWAAIAGVIGFAACFWLMMVVYTRSYPFPIRPLAVTALLVAATFCLYPALQYAEIEVDWHPGALVRLIVGATLIVLIVLAGVPRLMKGKMPTNLAIGFNWLALFAPRALAFVFIAWIAIWLYPNVPEAIGGGDLDRLDWLEWGLLGLLLIPLFFGGLPAGLHREYRRRLMSCYCVVREGEGARVGADPAISALAPLDGQAERSFPRLLISATANVRRRIPGKPTSLFVPFVLSFDRCGAPAIEDSAFDTRALELAQVEAGIVRRVREPLLTLFTAIACTGAAISPNMGYKTIPSFRPFIAALNFRLGRWLPNPFNASARREVAKLRGPGLLKFWPAFGDENDELMTDLMGLYGPRMYISDGGHYDNLGLLALLRARCKTIYCVDAGSDPEGKVNELERLLEIARAEGIVTTVAIDLTPFASTSGEPFDETHRVGAITYAGGETAELIVLKLGLTNQSSPALVARSRENRESWPQGARVKSVLLGLAALSALALGLLVWFNPAWEVMVGAGSILALSLAGLWFFQVRHVNSALNGFFPHHKTFTALWFEEPLATAYRDAGREVVDRYLGVAP